MHEAGTGECPPEVWATDPPTAQTASAMCQPRKCGSLLPHIERDGAGTAGGLGRYSPAWSILGVQRRSRFKPLPLVWWGTRKYLKMMLGVPPSVEVLAKIREKKKQRREKKGVYACGNGAPGGDGGGGGGGGKQRNGGGLEEREEEGIGISRDGQKRTREGGQWKSVKGGTHGQMGCTVEIRLRCPLVLVMVSEVMVVVVVVGKSDYSGGDIHRGVADRWSSDVAGGRDAASPW
ncbi:hypothetical protein WH47_04811 [Habropoda laboriosa]|uniref:Uncharacterized protein n=1 Tax=Habropoda laboriosa TaxID=597456 RepID=A0A0L7QVP3_9HYME|nr:hypothetical protein WH47_04811 [Habropoda laboriosa]